LGSHAIAAEILVVAVVTNVVLPVMWHAAQRGSRGVILLSPHIGGR